MLIQQAHTPSAQEGPAFTRAGCRSAGRIDPLLDRAMTMAKVGGWSCDLSDNSLSWTSGVYDLFGLSRDTALDRRQTVEMYSEESREAMEALRARAIDRGGVFTLDAQIIRPDGEMRWMRINGEMIYLAGGNPILPGSKQDVTDDRLRLETLRRQAENDALTGLAGRAVYEKRFLNTSRAALSILPLGALILFDLDDFKSINDRFGHLAGDACLRVFAQRLSESFPRALLTARIGGDEFAVIVSNDEQGDVLKARVARFQSQVRAPIRWREHMFTFGATSGIAVPTDPYCYDPEELFLTADAALYAAKKACCGLES